jgi:hypothetical protein
VAACHKGLQEWCLANNAVRCLDLLVQLWMHAASVLPCFVDRTGFRAASPWTMLELSVGLWVRACLVRFV